MSNLFGQIITPGQVEQAVAATLKLWMDDYLGEIERVEGYVPGTIERPLDVITRSQFDHWPEEQVPFLLVMTSGMAGQPERHAQGSYHASWLVGVACVVSDVTQEDTRRLALAYAAAVRAAVLQHKMLRSPLHPAGFANGSGWQDESYTDMPSDAERTLGASRVIFSIGVDDVVTERAGPRQPSGRPNVDPGNWPKVSSAKTNITPIGVGASS